MSSDRPPRHADLERLASRGAESLAKFILSLANDGNGIGAYVRAFVAGNEVAEARKLLIVELTDIRKGERDYDYRHRRGDVHLRRVDHLLDAIELAVLPVDPRAAFDLLTQVIAADGEIAEHAGDAWLRPTFDRACDMWFLAAEAVPKSETDRVLARLSACDDYGLRGRLNRRAAEETDAGCAQ